MTDKPTRRDLMKPVQLLGLAFVAAVFAGVVTLVSMGFFQNRVAGQSAHALMIGAIVAGVTFIATLLIIALLVLAVDPAQVAKPLDRPVLLPKDPPDAAAPAAPDAPSAPSGSPEPSPEPGEGSDPPEDAPRP